MPRKKPDTEETTKPRPRRKRKPKPVEPPSCWDVCRCRLNPAFDGDYVHICLGSTFVTRCELENMLNSVKESE